MQIHILASGSTGNSILVEMGDRRLLVDAGISCRRIERGLAAVGMQVGDLDGVLITHEHHDHIKGVPVLVRKHRVPIYARPATWQGMPDGDKIPTECRREIGEKLEFGSLQVVPFPISHDAADPVGYKFYHQNLKWVVATDLGMINRPLAEALAYSDLAVLESNHDLEMLQTGPYPHFLKQRIRGQKGHLSNHEAGYLLARIPKVRCMKVFLAHLSQQNNLPHLAERTVTDVLRSHDCAVGKDIMLYRTYPDRIVSLVR
ncbi:MAG: MBL fold metallo-hydrolase [Syntrophomonas sp.]|nr:MBL fold metallo-hydrolase [Syntrophomonas sp.]